MTLTQAKPALDQIWITQLDKEIPFEIPVASEDDGVGLLGFLLIDYPGEINWPVWGAGSPLLPSTLDDLDRKLVFNQIVGSGDFGPRDAVGCHRITLRVTHDDNFEYARLPRIIDRKDVAEAYWWLNVIDPAKGQDGSVLQNCPQPSTESR